LHRATVISPRRAIREAQTLLLESIDTMLVITDETSGQVIAVVTLHDLLRAQLAFAEKKH
jgi:hypothetical protein